MDRVLKHYQSFEHKNSVVEGIEDIIDVENEMGFGEGEEWSHEDAVGYAKLASLKQGSHRPYGYIRSRSNSPPRPQPTDNGIIKWHPQKPTHTVKHGSSLSKDDVHKLNIVHSVPHGEKHATSPSDFDDNDDAEVIIKDNEGTQEITDIMRHMQGNGDESKAPMQERPHNDDRDMSINNGHTGLSPQVITHNVDSEHRDRSPRTSKVSGANAENKMNRRSAPGSKGMGNKQANVVQRLNQGNVERIVPKSRAEKQRERASHPNRVRFSLDLETAERLMGCTDADEGGDVNEQEKVGGQQQENLQRNGKIIPDENFEEKGSAVKARAASTQRRKEPIMRDVRKDMSFDLEKAIEMREDKKAIRLAQERIERLEDALLRQQEIAANMRLSLAHEGLKDYGKLRQLLDALEKNIRKLAISRSRHFSESYQLKNRADQVERLKAHCNMLETDRERLRKKLEHLLESMKEKESELEGLMAERDTLLMHKSKDSESSLQDWDSRLKKVEADFAAEKGIWEDKLIACHSDWKDKQQKWAAELKEKEMELSSLKMSQERLVESLISCRQGVDELKDVIEGDAAGKKASRMDEGSVSVRTHVQSSPPHQLCSPCLTEGIDALELARSIYVDTESLKTLLQQPPSLQECKISLEAFKEESRILENKFSRTLCLTDKLKEEMEKKEDEIRKENESYEHIVAEKVKQVDALEKQLGEKENGMDALVKGLKDEVDLLSKELHQERSERSRLSDTQGDLKDKLMKGLQNRERKWEEEVEVLKGKLDEMTAAAALKDGRIDLLEEEVLAKAELLAHEKQKWDMAIKEVKHRAAKTILRFVHDKENGLLERLRERRRGHKTSEGQAGFTCKADDDPQDTSMYHQASSLRDKIHSNQSYVQARSMEMHNPRESQNSSQHGTDIERLSDIQESESRKSKRKQDHGSTRKRDKSPVQPYCPEEEFYPKAFKWVGKNRGMEKQDVLDILERRKGSGDNTFTLLQSTVQDLE